MHLLLLVLLLVVTITITIITMIAIITIVTIVTIIGIYMNIFVIGIYMYHMKITSPIVQHHGAACTIIHFMCSCSCLDEECPFLCGRDARVYVHLHLHLYLYGICLVNPAVAVRAGRRHMRFFAASRAEKMLYLPFRTLNIVHVFCHL